MPKKSILDSSSETSALKERLKDKKYIIYPTRVRPNKNINLLLEIFATVRRLYPNLLLVLTGTFENDSNCEKSFQDLDLAPNVVFAVGISDETLSWLYSTAECLVFTSQIEGNFPPQILEAIALGCPVVASRIPLIEEVSQDIGEFLLLADPSNTAEFVAHIMYVFKNREIVLMRQENLQKILNSRNSWDQFCQGLFRALNIDDKT